MFADGAVLLFPLFIGLTVIIFLILSPKQKPPTPAPPPPKPGDWVRALRSRYTVAMLEGNLPEGHGELFGLETGGMYVKDKNEDTIIVRCQDGQASYDVECYKSIVVVVPDNNLWPGRCDWIVRQRSLVGIFPKGVKV